MNNLSAETIDNPAAATSDYGPMFASLGVGVRSGRTRDLAWREAQLGALERMMSEREADIINALKKDLGKPALEAWTAEISYVAEDAAYCRKKLKRWTKPRKVYKASVAQPGKGWVQPEPLGTVLIIGAWN